MWRATVTQGKFIRRSDLNTLPFGRPAKSRRAPPCRQAKPDKRHFGIPDQIKPAQRVHSDAHIFGHGQSDLTRQVTGSGVTQQNPGQFRKRLRQPEIAILGGSTQICATPLRGHGKSYAQGRRQGS